MVTTRQIRKEPRAPVRRKRSFFGWIKFLLTTLAFWTLITYFASCKLSSPASSSDLCAKADQLSHLRDQYLIQPALSFARTHLDPHVRPYYEPASEVLHESFSKYYTGPIKKYGDASVSYVSSNWENNVKPVLATVPGRAVYGARQTKAVVFETVEPHVPEQVKEYAQLAQRAWDDYVHTVYLQILKAGNELSLQAQIYAPIVKSYYRRYAIPAFKSIHKTSSVVYKSYLLPASKEAWRIVTDIIVPWINAKVTPVVQQAYAKWVEPHVEKVYKRKEAPVAVQPSPSTPVASTSASNIQPTLSSASVKETASSSVITSTSKTQEPTTTASQPSSSTLAEVTDSTAVASIDDEEDEDDLEDFIAELRSVGQVTTSTASSETAKPSIVKKIRPQRADMEAKQKEWDEETDRRIAETKEKFINQLVTLRTEKVEESNQKFEKSLADLDIQADALLGKLQKYFGKKLSASEKTDEEVKEMLTDFENVGKSAVKKITDATESFKKELGQFNMTMERREKMMIVALQKSLTAHANAYETAMGIPWSYTVGVTRHDWTRYHALGKRCAAASIDMEAIRTGSIKVKELRKLQVYQNLEGFAEDADSLLDQFKDLIKRTLKKGQEKIEREKKASNLAAVEEEPLASRVDKEAVSASEVASESAHGVSSVVDSPDPIATNDLVPESNESGPTTAVEPEELSEKPSTSGPVDADDDVESPSPDAPDESINGNSSGNNSPAGAIPEEPIETERDAIEEIASELGTEVVPEEEEQHEPIINGDSGEEMVPPSSNKDEEDTTPAETATLADTEIDGSTPADPELDGTTPVELPVDVDVAVEDGKTQISVEDAVEDSITSPDAEELSKEDPTSVEEEQEVEQEENSMPTAAAEEVGKEQVQAVEDLLREHTEEETNRDRIEL